MIINLISKDNNTTITASKGDIVFVVLQWNPSSGFLWQDAETTAATLTEIKQEPIDPMVPPISGGLFNVHFNFKIIGAGIIQLFYARPWEATQSPAKWFEVTVVSP